MKENETISAGDVPGHEFHGNQYSEAARAASRVANAATKTAKTVAEHEAADNLHSKAADLHAIAASKALRTEKFRAVADKHFAAASQHSYQAAAHGSTAIALSTESGKARNPEGHTIGKVKAEEQTMKTPKNFAVRAKKALLKLSPTVRADAADVLVLDDMRDAVSSAAKGDARFNKKIDGSSADSSWTPWCTAIEFDPDEEAWAAVITAADGKYYRVGFEISKDGKVSLAADAAAEVTRKTQWVEARCAFNDIIPMVRASMPKRPTEADQGKESDAQKTAARKANLKTAVADAHEDAYPDGEAHGSKMSAHQNASWAHAYAAEQASAGPVKDFHKAAAEHHRQMADDHGKVVARNPASAEDLTQAAVLSSEGADTDAAHDHAAKTHRSASDAHSAAMVIAAKARKSDVAAKHAQLMSLHDACADAHAGDSDEALKASCEALSDVLKPGAVTATWSENDRDAVHCRASGGVRIEPKEVWEPTGEAKFVYMPLGVTSICAGFRGKAINLTVEVDEDTAKVVQKSFDDLRASFPKLEPFFCFEHREEEASFHPKGFEFGEVRGEQGVVVVGSPTKAGAENVNGRTHRTFSPSFTTDAEYDKATERNGVLSFPDGVRGSKANPAKVTGVAFCGGTLTNKPAFKNMPPVKAAQPKPPDEQPKKAPTVDEVFARLAKTKSEQPEAVKARKIEEVLARVGGKNGAPPPK